MGLAQQRGITLAAGAYRIERELVPLSYYPLPTAASSLTPTSLADHLRAVQQVIDASTRGGKWKIIRGYLDNAQLADLYTYLEQEKFTLITDPDGSAYYSVPMDNPATKPGPYPVTCIQAFKIPKLPLACAPPLAPGSSYADELVAKVNALGSGSVGDADFNLSAAELISKYHVPNYDWDKFNALIANLLRLASPDQAHPDQTRLDQVRNCWSSLLANLQSPSTINAQSSDRRKATLLDDLLECTDLASMSKAVERANFDLTYAYEQFIYDPATATPCFYSAYSQYRLDHKLPPVSASSVSIGSVKAALDALALPEKIRYYTSVYQCLKDGQPNPPPPAPATVSNRALAEAGKEEAEAKGRSACDARRTEFQAAIIEQLHRGNQYVVGDKYQWATAQDVNGNAVVQQTATLLTPDQVAAAVEQCQLDFMVQELVDQCKQDCKLTVVETQTNGQSSFQVGTDAEHTRLGQAMFNRLELNIDLTNPAATCNAGAGYASVPKLPGTSYQRVELTDAATSIIGYISQVFDGSNRLMAQPKRQVDAKLTKLGFSGRIRWFDRPE